MYFKHAYIYIYFLWGGGRGGIRNSHNIKVQISVTVKCSVMLFDNMLKVSSVFLAFYILYSTYYLMAAFPAPLSFYQTWHYNQDF